MNHIDNMIMHTQGTSLKQNIDDNNFEGVYNNLQTISRIYKSLKKSDRNKLLESLQHTYINGKLLYQAIKNMEICDLFYKELLSGAMYLHESENITDKKSRQKAISIYKKIVKDVLNLNRDERSELITLTHKQSNKISLGILKRKTEERKLKDYCYKAGKMMNENIITQTKDTGFSLSNANYILKDAIIEAIEIEEKERKLAEEAALDKELEEAIL